MVFLYNTLPRTANPSASRLHSVTPFRTHPVSSKPFFSSQTAYKRICPSRHPKDTRPMVPARCPKDKVGTRQRGTAGRTRAACTRVPCTSQGGVGALLPMSSTTGMLCLMSYIYTCQNIVRRRSIPILIYMLLPYETIRNLYT